MIKKNLKTFFSVYIINYVNIDKRVRKLLILTEKNLNKEVTKCVETAEITKHNIINLDHHIPKKY